MSCKDTEVQELKRSVNVRDVVIRPSEPEDYRAIHLVYSSSQAMSQTLGLPFSSEQEWRAELARRRDDNVSMVACVQGEIVGHLALSIYMNPRTRHSGHFGIAVRDVCKEKTSALN